MLWSHKAFEDSKAAITRATGRLQALKQEIRSVKSELVNKHAELEVVTSNLSSTQIQREEAQQQLDQTAMQLLLRSNINMSKPRMCYQRLPKNWIVRI
jgi:peptidoglycan hydrolase CwlO-like protein